MNVRLIKETRDLLPVFACTLPLIVVPSLLWADAGIGYFAMVVACVLMAGSSFGNEFQYRTLSMLLSQPIARSVIWREKMLALGAGMLMSLAALLGCLAVVGLGVERPDWLMVALVPLCAFCGAPFWTLVMRHAIGGMVCAVGAPCGIMAVTALVTDRLGGDVPVVVGLVVPPLLLLYCALALWLGYAKFKRLETVDSPSRELSLPASLEALFVAPLTKMSSRFRGPFAALLKKEFRLQQISFMLAGVFVLIALAGFCLSKHYPEVAAGIVGGDIFTYVLILPLIAGAVSVAEEKGWGMAEWHLTLPPSALKQWSAKMVATLSTSLVLGLMLPAAMFVVANPLFSQPRERMSLPPAFVILSWVFGQLLVTSVAVYAASIAKSTLQAILAAIAILGAAGSAIRLAAIWMQDVSRAPIPWIGPPPTGEELALSVLCAALVVMLCSIQWFAWSNFRRYSRSALRLITQLAVIVLAVWLLAWVCSSALFPPTSN